jgi:hypothetical protein
MLKRRAIMAIAMTVFFATFYIASHRFIKWLRGGMTVSLSDIEEPW